MKKPKNLIKTGVLIILGLAVGIGSVGMLNHREKIRQADISSEVRGEGALLQFLNANMIKEDGGVRTNYLDEKFADSHATGSDVLSESQGLLMEYAYRVRNQALFKQSLSFVEQAMTGKGILSYRYSETSGGYPVNAAIDDLRIIDALFRGAQAFQDDEYLEKACFYGKQLYQTNVQDSRLVDFFQLDSEQSCHKLTLCYADFAAMKSLGDYDRRWKAVGSNSKNTVLNGYLGDSFPLFATSYDYQAKTYDKKEIETIQALVTAIHLAQIDLCPDTTLKYVKNAVLNDGLYGRYTEKGEALNEVESTAIYALTAILGAISEDEDLEKASMKRMERFQISEIDHELYGGFADGNTKEAYSFDNLYALLAYAICSDN